MPPANRRRRNAHRDPTIHMTPEERRDYIRKQRMELSLSEAGLSVRSVNGLEEVGIYDVKTLLKQTREQLMAIKNLGEKTLDELISVIDGLDLEVPKDWKTKPTAAPKKKKKPPRLNPGKWYS